MQVITEPEIQAAAIAWDKIVKTIYQNPFIPTSELRPSARQVEFLAYEGHEALFGGSVGGGKALHVETPIPTLGGKKRMGDLLPGDFVFGMDGETTEVIAVSEVMTGRECWKLTLDGGSEIIADAEHRWLTCWRKDQFLGNGPKATIKTTKEIALTTIEGERSHAIPPAALPIRRFRYIVKCEEVESVPVRCIQVAAADGMFLAGPTFIPTHNSDALLMGALQYVTVPGYSALLLRRTYRHLTMDGGLVPRSKEWIGDKATFREKSMQWTFPSGATLTFGYYDSNDDFMLYQGGAWQFCGWDELTQFKENWYTYLFSRLRKPDWVCKHCRLPLTRQASGFLHRDSGSCAAPEPIPQPTDANGIALADVPLRVRGGSNPGGPGHEFCKRRFVAVGAPKKFVKSTLDDNPGLDKVAYRKGLAELDPITRMQLEQGDWNAYSGGRFKKEWFREFWAETNRQGDPVYKWDNLNGEGKIIADWPTCPLDGIPVSMTWNFIVCDPAARSEDANDYTAIGVFAVTPRGEILVLEIVRERLPLENIVPRISALCDAYSPQFVGIEDVAFQLGIVREGQRSLGVAIQRLSPEGKGKLVRATPAIIRASEGQMFVPKDEPKGKFPWLEDFLAELIQFTGDEKMDAHDDQTDVVCYAVNCLMRHGLAMPVVIDSDDDEEYISERGLGIFMTN
jgi:predicted phage terminase large subunit-like protein